MLARATLIGTVTEIQEKVMEGDYKVSLLNVETHRLHETKDKRTVSHISRHYVYCYSVHADYVKSHLKIGSLVVIEGYINNRKASGGNLDGRFVYNIQATDIRIINTLGDIEYGDYS